MMDLKDRADAFKKALLLKHPHITFNVSDYLTKADFINFNCSRHGPFVSSPRNIFRNKYGCDMCYKELVQLPSKDVVTPRKTTQEFIAEATVIHNGFYTYEHTVYETRLKPITVTCPLHGEFIIPQAAMHLVTKRGCLDCRREKSMLTRDEFIDKCKLRTKSFYIYDKTIYDGLNKDITVECIRHGEFTLKASSHINGKGCQECRALGMDLYKGRENR